MNSEFQIVAVARGKELQLHLSPALEVQGAEPVVYTFNHGLVRRRLNDLGGHLDVSDVFSRFAPISTDLGCPYEQVGKWDWVVASKIATAPPGTHLMFHTATHSLIYMDTMKMGGWKKTAEWGKGRSPDAVLEFYAFCLSTISQLSRKQPTTPICDVLNDQAYFNGVGNYLRAEILCRAGIDPMQPANEVFKATPTNINFGTFTGILKETSSSAPVDFNIKHDPGLMILYLTRQIQLEVIANDMNKYGTQDQQARFKAWLRVYEKGHFLKQGGRSIWHSQEQRLGRQKRDLGKLIDRYPCPVVAFYKSPTILFSGTNAETSSPSAAPNQPSTSGMASSSQAAPSSSFQQIKRVEENILPCDKIAELQIPMASKLLMATTSLGRSGKLDFASQSSVRDTILMNNPVAYSAWQVFEANGDEDDLVDTLKTAAKTAVAQETGSSPSLVQLLQALVLEAASAPSAVLLASHPGISHFSIPTAGFVEPRATLPSLGARKLAPKREKPTKSSFVASSSSSSSQSGESDEDEEIMERPSKKARGKEVFKATKPKKRDAKAEFGAMPSLGFGKTTAHTSTPSAAGFSTGPTTSVASLASLLTDKSWSSALGLYLNSPGMRTLHTFLSGAYTKGVPPVYPKAEDIFAAFNMCPLEQVKVVILGQDPYHGAGQAHGLCFSVLPPTPPPPSLVNIFKELESDIPGFKAPAHGDLSSWAKQGVFLLNTVLTVFEHKPNSHAGMGWEDFTDLAIKTINSQRKGVVFMLWGKPAHKKEKLIDMHTHHILKAPHPSPLSAFQGWFGSKHFSRANILLKAGGLQQIDWNLPQQS